MKKNKLLIIISSIFIIYSLLGFIILPKILKPIIIENINKNITQTATLEKIEFNPFLLNFSIHNFKISQNEKTTFSLEKLYVDFNFFKSIDKRYLAFKDLKISNVFVHIIENEDKSFNVEKLLKESTDDTKTKVSTEESTQTIKFQIFKTIIEKAKVKFTKLEKNKKPFEVEINDLNYTLYDMGTFSNNLASHNLDILINKHAKLLIKGGMKLSPFHMYGNVKLTNLKPGEYLAYKAELFNFDSPKKSTIDLDFGYILDYKDSLTIDINNLNFDLKDLELIQEKNTLLSLKALNLNNLNLKYPQNNVLVENFTLNKLDTNITVDKEEKINLNKLFNLPKEETKTEEKSKKEENSKPWNIKVSNFNLIKSKLTYFDENAMLNLLGENIDLSLKDLSYDGSKALLEKATLKNEVFDFNSKKDEIKVKAQNLNLEINQTNFHDNNLFINSIKLLNPSLEFNDNKTKKEILAKDLTLEIQDLKKQKEDIEVSSINLIQPEINYKDDISKVAVLSKNINLLVNKVSYINNHMKIKSSSLNEPFIGVTLKKQEKTKDTKIEEKIVKSKKTNTNNFAFDIGPFNIKNATMSFEDKNLPIPFKTDITNLSGNFSKLDSSSSKPTRLKLEGEVDKYGYTKITGIVNVTDIKLLTDTNLLFKNIAIKNFTPYSGKFVGREIESGKLNLDLKYNITKSDLKASNSIIISDIKLGKTVKSDEATNLPLELAIALLEDTNGVIDLEIPVTGNVDDPKFSIGAIVWKAFTNLITKAISSPFQLLGSIFGFDPEKIKTLDFEYGSAQILASEKESLDNIAKILEKRKKLAISIKIAYHEKYDFEALQNKKFQIVLREKIKNISGKDKYKKALEEIFEEKIETQDLDEVVERFTKETKDKEKIFDTKSYVRFLREELASLEKVSKEELKNLAKQRGIEVVNYLTKEKSIDKNAIIVEEGINIINDKNTKWTIFNLNVSKRK
ncbi:hypothetical protein CP965_03530 [Halarcobacter mediterraneus]|uniref:DUF748 domain-containing protein n=2 Tax=Arcobacteraceae TaxID=2808963 RepID=A0A4Q1B0I7_9BACT|nr:DUF748 domain-containing protein [Halarcobacter mediterraneus]RXK14532.1 hypothetical protein CP965_03530 [Halarcobacter mediterraneus]